MKARYKAAIAAAPLLAATYYFQQRGSSVHRACQQVDGARVVQKEGTGLGAGIVWNESAHYSADLCADDTTPELAQKKLAGIIQRDCTASHMDIRWCVAQGDVNVTEVSLLMHGFESYIRGLNMQSKY